MRTAGSKRKGKEEEENVDTPDLAGHERQPEAVANTVQASSRDKATAAASTVQGYKSASKYLYRCRNVMFTAIGLKKRRKIIG
mmetsp:Transcript_4505/g.16456  ORF Transcript_4505/g.16456 Transcript_4505/m.16456 type:complete len:83 (+) Transcript_4505:477-725(+)